MSLNRNGEYAVIFVNKLPEMTKEYSEMALEMVMLAKEMDGFCGVESVRDATGNGITVSYWRDLASIEKWKKHPRHLLAQKAGREKFYAQFELQIAHIIKSYDFKK